MAPEVPDIFAEVLSDLRWTPIRCEAKEGPTPFVPEPLCGRDQRTLTVWPRKRLVATGLFAIQAVDQGPEPTALSGPE
jgi:hypothetical protein